MSPKVLKLLLLLLLLDLAFQEDSHEVLKMGWHSCLSKAAPDH